MVRFAPAHRARMPSPGIGPGHPAWRRYYNAEQDFTALQRLRGVGPRRAEWLMEACGGVPAFLALFPEEIASRTQGRISARFVHRLQRDALRRGIAQSWASALSPLVEAAPPPPPDTARRTRPGTGGGRLRRGLRQLAAAALRVWNDERSLPLGG